MKWMTAFSFVLLCVCFSQCVSGQKKLALEGNNRQLYLCMSGTGTAANTSGGTNDIGTVQLIGGGDISSGNTLNINTLTLTKAIRKAFPDSLMQGIGVLDWEGKELGILRRLPATDPSFKTALSKMMTLLDIAQQLRPNVSWGFYGLPVREFWKRNSDWRESGDRIMPLLQKQDILFPSVYLLYSSAAVTTLTASDYTKDNVRQAIRLGAKVNKPVLPFVYHRYPDFSLVPLDVFRKQAEDILSQEVAGKKVAGIVWWGADNYYYRTKNKVLVREAAREQDAQQHFDSLIQQYSQELLKVVKAK
jgi:hypothetical protein